MTLYFVSYEELACMYNCLVARLQFCLLIINSLLLDLLKVITCTHKNGQSTEISAPQWHPYTPWWTVMNLQGQQNAACKSRPGHL